MRPAQFEIGLVVIVFGFFPLIAAVAAIALFAVTTPMDVVATMAGKTLHRRILIPLVRMAGGADDLFMSIDERKIGGAVVEFALGPGGGGMAVGALLTEIALVDILLFVTIDAQAGRFAPGLVLFVAAVALDTFMRAVQGIVGLGVIEKFFVEQDDLGITALMVGMARTAGRIANLVGAAMVTLARLDVGIDFLMAVQAKGILGGFAKTLVATGALALFFGVALDELAWHQ